jgi:hypothetical protein
MRDITKLTRVHPTEMALPENFVAELKRLPLPKMGSQDDRERDALGARGRNDGRGGGRGRPQHGQVHRGGTNRETSRDASPRGPVANPLGGRGHSGTARPGGWSPVEGQADRGERAPRPQGERMAARGDRPARTDRPGGGNGGAGRPFRGGGNRGGQPGGGARRPS